MRRKYYQVILLSRNDSSKEDSVDTKIGVHPSGKKSHVRMERLECFQVGKQIPYVEIG